MGYELLCRGRDRQNSKLKLNYVLEEKLFSLPIFLV